MVDMTFGWAHLPDHCLIAQNVHTIEAVFEFEAAIPS